MLGVPSSFAAAAGCIIGGRLSDAWKRRDRRGRVFVCMLPMILSPPVAYAALGAADLRILCLLYSLWSMVSSLWIGSGAAIIQDSVLPRMRGTAGATFLLAVSLIGLALGPYGVGRVSVLTGSLHLAILSVLLVSPIALLVMWQVSRGLPFAEAAKGARAQAAGEPLPLAGAG
jgi:MFS family permease